MSASIIGVLAMVITVVAMFVTIRERVKNHEERLQLHANQIKDLESNDKSHSVLLGRIETKLDMLLENGGKC